MRLPSVQYSDRISKYKQIRFNGLNHNVGAGDGELWDMKNMEKVLSSTFLCNFQISCSKITFISITG